MEFFGFLFWLLFSLVVGFVGSSRRIGFGFAFLLSVLLSPLIGLIIVALSKSKSTIAYEQQMLDFQKQQQAAMNRANPPPPTVSEQLETLKSMRNNGTITMAEFQEQRDKLLINL